MGNSWVMDKEQLENSLNMCKDLVIEYLISKNMIIPEDAKIFLNNNMIVVKDLNKISEFVKKFLKIKSEDQQNYRMLIVKMENLYIDDENDDTDETKKKLKIVKPENPEEVK